nr:hypothetical protein [Tanacetum cinerariifolium]
VLERDIELKDNKIEYLRNELEDVKKEKESIDFKIEKFENASKDLDRLLGSQQLDKDKKGVGFNEYCAIPPPSTQVYSPLKKDLSWMGLPEFVDDTVTDYTRPTPSIDVSKSVSKELQERWKSNNPSFFEQVGSSGNVVSTPMFKFVKESGCPNANKVNNAENARKPTVKYAEIFDHLEFNCKHDIWIDKGKTWTRVNHAQDNMKYTSTHKSMTPRAVLLKFGTKPIAINRPFSTARPTLNNAQQKMISFVKTTHSNVKRPFERKSTSKNKVEVPTVRPKIPTVGLKVQAAKPTIAADKGNKGKVVKASARWIWKPKQNSSSQGSNFNGVSGIPQDNINDKGYWDSGCSRHMTGNISYLSEYEPFNRGYVSFGHGRGKITDKGSIKTGTSRIRVFIEYSWPVLDCPHWLYINLVHKSYSHVSLSVLSVREGGDSENSANGLNRDPMTINLSMTKLAFCDSHNMVAILEKIEHNTDFHQIVDFLEASHIMYALTVRPTVYVSHIQQFWSTARVETMDGETKILAKVNGRQRTVSESSIKRHLKLNDEEATNRTYNFSKMIFDGMMRNVKSKGEFLMYPSFIEKLLKMSQFGVIKHTEVYSVPFHTQKVFSTLRVNNLSFSGRTVKLFASMLVPQGEGSEHPSEPRHTPSDQDEPIHHEQITQSPQHAQITSHDPITQFSQYEQTTSQEPTILSQSHSVITTHRRIEEGLYGFLSLKSLHLDQMRLHFQHEMPDMKRLSLIDKSADKGSDSTYDMANVLGTLEAANILANGGLRLVFTTASIVVSPAITNPSRSFHTALARDLEAKFAQEDQTIREQAERDSEIARIHAERELEMMIAELDRSNEIVAKYLSEYEQAEAGLSHDEKKAKDFKGMNFEQNEEKFILVWEKMQDFVPMNSKLESKRLKRQGIQLGKESFKKLKTTKASEVYQIFDDMLKKFNREDLDRLWSLVKENYSTTEVTDEKEKELWVELKRLYEPDSRDPLWALQRYMHDPLVWRLYDTCGVYHVSTRRGYEIFMLVEKDYLLTKGLTTLMLCNKLQVDQYSKMANELLMKTYIIANSPR